MTEEEIYLTTLRMDNERLIELTNELGKEHKQQERLIKELRDFAIWMTGCGYDFTQHEYFIEKREQLLNNSK